MSTCHLTQHAQYTHVDDALAAAASDDALAAVVAEVLIDILNASTLSLNAFSWSSSRIDAMNLFNFSLGPTFNDPKYGFDSLDTCMVTNSSVQSLTHHVESLLRRGLSLYFAGVHACHIAWSTMHSCTVVDR